MVREASWRLVVGDMLDVVIMKFFGSERVERAGCFDDDMTGCFSEDKVILHGFSIYGGTYSDDAE